MRLFVFAILIAGIVSCKSVSKNITGIYEKKGVGYKYHLALNKDSSFSFSHASFEFKSECKGRWSLLENDTIFLKCLGGSNEVLALISSGYMTVRERKVIILRNKKIRVENSVLKKVK